MVDTKILKYTRTVLMLTMIVMTCVDEVIPYLVTVFLMVIISCSIDSE